MIRLRLGRSVVVGCTLVLVASFPAAADTHSDGEGRLSANSGGGGFVVDAPVHHRYWASFGNWPLCDTAVDKGGADGTITITGVRPVLAKHEPLEVRAYVRRVTPEMVADNPDEPAGTFSAFWGLIGRPSVFDQPYAHPRWRALGHYTRDVAGTEVRRGCHDATVDAYADDDDRVPDHAWSSLVLAVKVGRHGGRVRRTLVDYTVDGVAHTLKIDWTVGGQGFRHSH